MNSNATLPRLAFVGRSADRDLLRGAMNRARGGSGGLIFLVSEGGVGKTRLAELAGEEAARDGFMVATGRAYPVESGVPYALFSDALLPLVRRLDKSTLTNLTRGELTDLAHLFPGIAEPSSPAAPIQDPAEFRTRLFWTLAEFLSRLAQRAPLLVVLDDVHWADASSLELLHFLVRQISQQPILFLCTYNDAERETLGGLRTLERSLAGLGVARIHRLAPLTLADTQTVIEQTFDARESVVAGFVGRIFEWTNGNPFFLQETLQSLIARGSLYQRDGIWLGWEVHQLEVPATVRDMVAERLRDLTDAGRSIAELAAVLGTRFDLDVIRAVWRGDEAGLVAALEELRLGRILVEQEDRGRVSYDFAHPMFRQAAYAELGIARAKMLHGQVAELLEKHYQAKARDTALDHANELAYHFARAELRADATKAVTYLAAAGARALSRLADREAADYLSLALDLVASHDDDAVEEPVRIAVIENLARARQRLGEFDAAVELFSRVRAFAEQNDDYTRVAEQDRRIALSYYWSSRHAQALTHFDSGLAAAARAENDAMRVRLLLARGACLMELGRADDARTDIESALALTETRQDSLARARALRALLQLHTWCGPPDLARQHGHAAIDLAKQLGAADVLFQSHWTLAALEGLTGHTATMAQHIAEADRVAHELRSPMLELWTSELIVEYAFAVGEWEMGLARGEQGIALARSLNQRQLLPRLLVWTALIYIGRGDFERAKAMVDEAWLLSGAGSVSAAGAAGSAGATGPAGATGASSQPVDVHTVVPAHIGLATYHLARWEFEDAVRIAQAGLEIADRSGYAFWAIHRLLPIIAEACLHTNDLEYAELIAHRLHEQSQPLEHKLGLAWAQTCRALIVWRGGDSERGARMMSEALNALEAVPIIPDATRLRRQLAGRLADIGDRAGALRELRHVHTVFVRLGAERELEKTRTQFRELDTRPPARDAASGAEGLTGRELAIARLIAQRKSNKAIGNTLRISPRTVSTHLSSIFRKVGVSSRAELADYVRVNGLLGT